MKSSKKKTGIEETEIVLDVDDLTAIHASRLRKADSYASGARGKIAWESGLTADERLQKTREAEYLMEQMKIHLNQARKLATAIGAFEESGSCTADAKAKARILWTPSGITITTMESK